MKKIAVAVSLLILCGCAKTVSEQWSKQVGTKTHDDWHSAQVWANFYSGFFWNLIPGFHLPGLLIDTAIVYGSIDDVVLGNGAIVGRARKCPQIVELEDYELFFAWQGAHRREVERTFIEIFEKKDDLTAKPRNFSARLGPAAKVALEKKTQEKIASKLGSKMLGKVVAKSLVGFIPLVGPTVAATINYIILNDIHINSIQYFEMKAKIVCQNS